MAHFTLYYFNGRGRAEICRMLFAAASIQFTDKRIEFNEWNNYRSKMPGCCLPVLEIDGKIRMPESMAIARYLAREYGFHGKNNMDMFRIDFICDCLYEMFHDYMRWYHEKHGRFKYSTSAVTNPPAKKPPGTTAPGTNTSASKPSGTTPSGMNPPGTKPPGTKPPGNKPPGNKPPGNKPPANKPPGANTVSVIAGTKALSVNVSGNEIVTALHNQYNDTCRRVFPYLERTLCMRNEGNHFFMGEQVMLCDMMCYCCLEGPIRDNPTLLSNYPKLSALRNRVASNSRIAAYLKKRCQTEW